MMPKVLFHICDGIYPSVVGGMEIFNYFLIKNLAKNDGAYVFSSRPYDFNGVEWIKYRRIHPTKIFDGVQLFFALLRHRDIETVAFSYSEAHWLLWYINMLAVRLAGRKYISIIHHGRVPSSENVKQYGEFLRHSENVIAVSDDIKKNYDSVFGIDCTVIPPLIPFGLSKLSRADCRKRYGIPDDASVFCQVGTIKKMKNPQTVVEALSLFSEEELEKYNPHVVFAGKNCMRDSLQLLIREKGLESRVHFLGSIPVEDVRNIMRMSDLYLIASDYEGTSVSLLEAMYNAMPILASDVRGINDMVSDRESALLFSVNDANDLKNVLLKMLNSQKLRISLGERAKSVYSVKYDYPLILDAYRKLLYLL